MGFVQGARRRLVSAAHVARRHGGAIAATVAAAATVAGAVHADRAIAAEVRRRVREAPLVGAYRGYNDLVRDHK